MNFLPYKDWTPDDDYVDRDDSMDGHRRREAMRRITIQGFDNREELIEHLEATGATPEDIEKVREHFREADRRFGRSDE